MFETVVSGLFQAGQTALLSNFALEVATVALTVTTNPRYANVNIT